MLIYSSRFGGLRVHCGQFLFCSKDVLFKTQSVAFCYFIVITKLDTLKEQLTEYESYKAIVLLKLCNSNYAQLA